jgi:hypothetical protein
MVGAIIATPVSGLPPWLKLAAAGVCLTGAAAGVMGVAGVSLARAYLIRQAGWQAQADAQRLAGQALAAVWRPRRYWAARAPAGSLSRCRAPEGNG